jgi:anti-sigma regulatory factor (Ser/Thr protein kinase)
MAARCDSLLGLDLPAEPESVTRARHAVQEIAREVGAREADVALAVSEAVGNAVVHAYRDQAPGPIRIRAGLHEPHLLVEVSDDGRGMTPHVDARGLGMGIALISRISDGVRFDSTEAGTTVVMRFRARDSG